MTAKGKRECRQLVNVTVKKQVKLQFAQLKLLYSFPYPHQIMSLIVDTLYNPCWSCLVAGHPFSILRTSINKCGPPTGDLPLLDKDKNCIQCGFVSWQITGPLNDNRHCSSSTINGLKAWGGSQYYWASSWLPLPSASGKESLRTHAQYHIWHCMPLILSKGF